MQGRLALCGTLQHSSARQPTLCAGTGQAANTALGGLGFGVVVYPNPQPLHAVCSVGKDMSRAVHGVRQTVGVIYCSASSLRLRAGLLSVLLEMPALTAAQLAALAVPSSAVPCG